MKALGFRLCISSPYSFLSAPIEYAFGFFKSVCIIPSDVKTGKKYDTFLRLTCLDLLETSQTQYSKG